MTLAGGLARGAADLLVPRVSSLVRDVAPAAEVSVLHAPPVLGAALLGLDRLAPGDHAAADRLRDGDRRLGRGAAVRPGLGPHALVVDQAHALDPDRHRQQRTGVADRRQLLERVGIGDRDVVGLGAAARTPRIAAIDARIARRVALAVADARDRPRAARDGSTGAAARPAGERRALREDRASPSGSRTVSSATTSVGSARSSAIRRITRTCW